MNLLHASASPHERTPLRTGHIMGMVLLALLPAAIHGCFAFGLKALFVLLATTGSAVLFECAFRLIFRRPQTIMDGSAAVTGLLVGLNLPPDIPVWQAVIGSFAAIVVVKQLFGGLGQNFANPAIVGRIVLMISFPSTMAAWSMSGTDAVSSATPLVSGTAEYWDLFLGNTPGCIGETCAAAILLGGIFLCICRVITPLIPLSYLGSFALFTWLGGNDPLYQLLAGGLILGAVFMATDYVTSPVTPFGKLIFGIGCGGLTFLLRQFSGYPEGVSFAILLMNLLTPYIDRFTRIKPFGVLPEERESANE